MVITPYNPFLWQCFSSFNVHRNFNNTNDNTEFVEYLLILDIVLRTFSNYFI